MVCGRAFSWKPFFLNRVLSTTESLTQLSAYPGNPGKAPAWQRGDETPKRWLNCNLSSHHLLPGLRREPTERSTKARTWFLPRGAGSRLKGPKWSWGLGISAGASQGKEQSPGCDSGPQPPPGQEDTRHGQDRREMGRHAGASASLRPHRARPRPRDTRVQTPQTSGIPENSMLELRVQKRPVTAWTRLRALPHPPSGRALEQAPASENSSPAAQRRVTRGPHPPSGPRTHLPPPRPHGQCPRLRFACQNQIARGTARRARREL